MTSSFIHERLLLSLLGGVPVADLDRDGIDPATFTDLCRRHRAAGMAYQALAADSKPWPATILEPLREARQKTLVDNLVLLKVLGETATALEENGIPFVILKGASLLEVLYTEIHLRPMTDIDFLIRKHDWPAVAQALGRRGYILPSAEAERYYSETWYHQLVESPDWPPCFVELHWNIESSERSRVDPAELFRDAVRFAVDGRQYLRLSNEHLLLHLLVHFAHHYNDPSLHWLVDLRLLLKDEEFDWDRIESTARAWRVGNALAYSLAFLDRVFPGSVSAEAWRFRLSPARRLILRSLKTPDPTLLHRRLEGSPLRHLVSMAILDRWRDVGRYVMLHSAQRLRRLFRPLPTFPEAERRHRPPTPPGDEPVGPPERRSRP
jgi:hypothetical protein